MTSTTILWGSGCIPRFSVFANRHLSHYTNLVDELNHLGHAAPGLHAIESPFQTLQHLNKVGGGIDVGAGKNSVSH